ncbi:MAG TPA: helix-turn-helix transcriptional regulator [Candidatus Angelobacter sp.]
MPKRTLESLGRLVREKRGQRKIRETAREIGIGTATLMRIENGRIPDVETFGKVCKWLSIDPGSFLGFETQANHPPGSVAQIALTSIAVHYKADQNPQPATVQAIAQMVLLAMQSQPRQIDVEL